jgi:hypothetical protein
MSKHIIKEHTHRSNSSKINFKILLDSFKNNFIYHKIVRFDENCLISDKVLSDFSNKEKQYLLTQINKVFGVAFIHHHYKSLRFGWRPNGNKIDIFAYYYNKELSNSFIHKYLTSINVNELYNFVIEVNTEVKKVRFKVYKIRINKPLFNINDINDFESYEELDFPVSWYDKLLTYDLYPYFGGKIPAPKDMTLHI